MKFTEDRPLSFIIGLLFFTGSVFFTSGKFVNATNTPKFYFCVAALVVTAMFIVISRKQLYFGKITGKTMLWSLGIICFLQACYGLLQFMDWLPSNHSKFVITGSFDNPAGFAAILAMSFPINLFLLIKAKKIEKYLTAVILMVIALAVFLSGARSGIFAIIISSVVFSILKTNVLIFFKIPTVINYKSKCTTFGFIIFLISGVIHKRNIL